MFPEEFPALPTLERPSRPRSRLLKAHSCAVPYPDGTEGECRYERLGPTCHRFLFRYADGAPLSRQYHTRPLGNDPQSIEAEARRRADDAFRNAIERERVDYFARATEPTSGSRKADPSKYRMAANRAKRLGGKYALCQYVGSKLIPVSLAFDRMDEVGKLWEERRHPDLVIGCCNRLDRCWEMVKYNPWCAQGHPRREEG